MTKDLHVYLHTELDVRGLQKMLEPALSGWSVQVFGRRRDFEKGVRSGPDAVLAIAPVLASVGRLSDIKGLVGGKDTEPYELLGRESVDPARVGTVGAVDLLGRHATTDFIRRMTGSSARVELVTKTIDLVSLIRFKKADAVLIPERLVRLARDSTEIPLVTTALPRPSVGVAAFSVVSGMAELKQRVSGFSAIINSRMGVTSWR